MMRCNHGVLMLVVCLSALLLCVGCRSVGEDAGGESPAPAAASPAVPAPEPPPPPPAAPAAPAADNIKPQPDTGEEPTAMADSPEITTDTVVIIEMDAGEMAVRLRPDVAPKTCESIVSLARAGFYDGVVFHRVEPRILIQGGDPDGNGTGGPGYTVDAEFSDLPHTRGTVAMARRGDDINSAGSQFYICLRALPSLDGDYTVFCQVVRGMEVADGVRVGDVMRRVYVEGEAE